jgi:predicted transcriptional regulator
MVHKYHNNRNNLDIVAAVLEESQTGSGISRIMNNANLSYNLVRNYLRVALNSNLIELRDSCYKTTEKGKKYLERYSNLKGEKIKVQESLKTIDEEKKNLSNLLSMKEEGLIEEPSQQKKETNTFLVASIVIARIKLETFYNELLELGFETSEAAEIASWVKIIKDHSPTFLSGKKVCTIKACLAYIGGQVFGDSRKFSQDKIAKFYDLYHWTINRTYRSFMTILRETCPDALEGKHNSQPHTTNA